MKNTLVLIVGAVALLMGAAQVTVYAQHGQHDQHGDHQHKQQTVAKEAGKTITIVGEVIDPVCYIRHEMQGAKHKKCATTCAKGGVTLGILEDGTKTIYVSFPQGHGNPNAALLGYVADHVKVTGEYIEGGGLKGIEVKTVERVQ